MIETTTKKGTRVYVTSTDDCEENEGGLFCQVYADEDLGQELDYFTITEEELAEKDSDTLMREYVNSITEY